MAEIGKAQTVTVDMSPFGKARPRVTSNGTFMPRDYETKRHELKLRFGPVLVGPPYGIEVTAVRQMPKSWSKKKRLEMDGQYCTAGADADNIVGAVMDTLFPDDDSAVVVATCRRIWGESSRMDIELWEAR